jgi:hypothetical protein
MQPREQTILLAENFGFKKERSFYIFTFENGNQMVFNPENMHLGINSKQNKCYIYLKTISNAKNFSDIFKAIKA